jgi:isoquinoline 1-oxidoreductase beta subunit
VLTGTQAVAAKITGLALDKVTVHDLLIGGGFGQGALIFGLTAALYGKITIDKGRVQQSNFNDYRMLRINETPQIEVHLIKSGEAPGGIGESGVTAAPPALANAICAATGIRLRRLPIDRDVLSGKKSS